MKAVEATRLTSRLFWDLLSIDPMIESQAAGAWANLKADEEILIVADRIVNEEVK